MIVAAPTMVTPGAVSASVIPRGLVQAPHSQTLPPLAVNSAIKSGRGVDPFETTPSAPPFVPIRAALARFTKEVNSSARPPHATGALRKFVRATHLLLEFIE